MLTEDEIRSELKRFAWMTSDYAGAKDRGDTYVKELMRKWACRSDVDAARWAAMVSHVIDAHTNPNKLPMMGEWIEAYHASAPARDGVPVRSTITLEEMLSGMTPRQARATLKFVEASRSRMPDDVLKRLQELAAQCPPEPVPPVDLPPVHRKIADERARQIVQREPGDDVEEQIEVHESEGDGEPL